MTGSLFDRFNGAASDRSYVSATAPNGNETKSQGAEAQNRDNWFKRSLAMKTLNSLNRFAKDESGATAIEYGLIAAGISLAIIAVVNGLGTNLNTKFTDINSSLK